MKKSLPQTKTKSSLSQKFVTPVANMLRDQLKKLEKRKREIDKDDPFKNADRMNENTSMDDTATEQFGHAQVVAMKEQIDRRIVQIRKALTMIKVGKYGVCDDCGKMIETKRLMFEPEATFCASCQGKRER
jgi:RNA polymerase-binding transcription factor DksA